MEFIFLLGPISLIYQSRAGAILSLNWKSTVQTDEWYWDHVYWTGQVVACNMQPYRRLPLKMRQTFKDEWKCSSACKAGIFTIISPRGYNIRLLYSDTFPRNIINSPLFPNAPRQMTADIQDPGADSSGCYNFAFGPAHPSR